MPFPPDSFHGFNPWIVESMDCLVHGLHNPLGIVGTVRIERMYTRPDFPSKKKLREAVERGQEVTVYNPGPLPVMHKHGQVDVEGPHYPRPHTWYATVAVDGFRITKVLK